MLPKIVIGVIILLVLIKSIGFQLNYYDPKTNRAGDILFTPKTFGPLAPMEGFGFWKEAEGRTYRNPQPGFICRLFRV